MSISLRDKIENAREFILSRSKINPQIGIILGTGLGALAEEIEDKDVIPYRDIPHFAISTAPGQKGNLILGKLGGKEVIAMQGSPITLT